MQPPSEKNYPPLFQQTPSKSWGPVKPPLFENLVEGSFGEGGEHHGFIMACKWRIADNEGERFMILNILINANESMKTLSDSMRCRGHMLT